MYFYFRKETPINMKLKNIVFVNLILSISCVIASDKTAIKWSIKDIVFHYYHNQPLYVGCAGHQQAIGKTSGKILDREFSYVTPSNDFKLTVIHPGPQIWSWEKSDAWIAHIKKTGQLLRMHSPISPQVSKWVKEDNRTPEELRNMMDEFLIALFKRYASNPQIKWVDVVNETIFHEEKEDSFGKLTKGGWFSRREGTDKWENPWTILGFDNTNSLGTPIYIDRAFELAEQYAPNLKLVFNQQGQFEQEVWEKVKLTLNYLRFDKKRRVDAVGWQAHIEAGWEKQPGNMERLSSFIDWCHKEKMEFHITEFNVYTHKSKNHYTNEEQADTYSAITKLLISKLKTGVIGINFWNIQDDETGMPEWKGAMWDENGFPKASYMKFKETLIKSAKSL